MSSACIFRPWGRGVAVRFTYYIKLAVARSPYFSSPPAVTLQLFSIFPPIKRPKRKFLRPPREVECKYTFYNVLSHSVAPQKKTPFNKDFYSDFGF